MTFVNKRNSLLLVLVMSVAFLIVSAHFVQAASQCTYSTDSSELPNGSCVNNTCYYGGLSCNPSANPSQCATGYTCESAPEGSQPGAGTECIFTGEASSQPVTSGQLGVCGSSQGTNDGCPTGESCINGDSTQAYCSTSGTVQGNSNIQQLLGNLPSSELSSCTGLNNNSATLSSGITSCETNFCAQATALGYSCNTATNCTNVYNQGMNGVPGSWDYSCSLSGNGALGFLNESLNPAAVVGEQGNAAGNGWWTLQGQGTGTPVIPTLPSAPKMPVVIPTSTAPVANIVKGVQGYDPAAVSPYTDGTAVAGTYLVLYSYGGSESFGASGNTVTINGAPATISYQSAAQINISLGNLPASIQQYLVVVTTPTGSTGSSVFTIAAAPAAGSTGSGSGTGSGSCAQAETQLLTVAQSVLNSVLAANSPTYTAAVRAYTDSCGGTGTGSGGTGTGTGTGTGSGGTTANVVINSITGVAGYDANSTTYTDGNDISPGMYLVLFGNFSAANDTTVDGQPATVTYQNDQQLNISLANVAVGQHTVAVTPNSGTTATATFTIVPAGSAIAKNPTPIASLASCPNVAPMMLSAPLTIAVVVPTLNVRSSPSTSAPRSGSLTLSEGDTFTAIAEVEGACVTDINGGSNLWWESSKDNFVWAGGTTVQGNAPVGSSVSSGSSTGSGSTSGNLTLGDYCAANPTNAGCFAIVGSAGGSGGSSSGIAIVDYCINNSTNPICSVPITQGTSTTVNILAQTYCPNNNQANCSLPTATLNQVNSTLGSGSTPVCSPECGPAATCTNDVNGNPVCISSGFSAATSDCSSEQASTQNCTGGSVCTITSNGGTTCVVPPDSGSGSCSPTDPTCLNSGTVVSYDCTSDYSCQAITGSTGEYTNVGDCQSLCTPPSDSTTASSGGGGGGSDCSSFGQITCDGGGCAEDIAQCSRDVQ